MRGRGRGERESNGVMDTGEGDQAIKGMKTAIPEAGDMEIKVDLGRRRNL